MTIVGDSFFKTPGLKTDQSVYSLTTDNYEAEQERHNASRLSIVLVGLCGLSTTITRHAGLRHMVHCEPGSCGHNRAFDLTTA